TRMYGPAVSCKRNRGGCLVLCRSIRPLRGAHVAPGHISSFLSRRPRWETGVLHVVVVHFFCLTARQAFSRPRRDKTGARRCWQGWPLLRPPSGSALTGSSTTARWQGRGRTRQIRQKFSSRVSMAARGRQGTYEAWTALEREPRLTRATARFIPSA